MAARDPARLRKAILLGGDTPAPSAVPAAESPWRLRIAVACVMVGAFVQSLDQTIANVALPHMQGGLQADRDEVTWILTSYLIACALATPPMGWLTARFGLKNVFVLSLGAFTITSALCGTAQSLDEIVVLRFFQGIGGAALLPLSQAIVIERFSLEQRGKIMSLWATSMMLGPVLGPSLGGWLTDNYSWRWIFYINVPIGVLAILGVVFLLAPTRRVPEERFDLVGFAFFSLALGSFQLLLDRGTTQDWFHSREIIIEAGLCALGAYLFVVHTATSRNQLFPPAMLADRYFAPGAVLSCLVAGMLIATSVLLPPFLQTLGGYSVLDVGLMLVPRGVGSVLCMQVMARLIARFDPRAFIIVGSFVTIWTLWRMSLWTPSIDFVSVCVMCVIQGFAMACVFIPVNTLAFTTLPPAYQTHGASLLNLLRFVGSALSVTLTTVVVTSSTQAMHAEIAGHVTPFNRALSNGAGGLFWNPGFPQGAEALNAVVDRGAAAVAYSNAFLFMAWVSVIIPIVALMIPRPPRAGAVDAPKAVTEPRA